MSLAVTSHHACLTVFRFLICMNVNAPRLFKCPYRLWLLHGAEPQFSCTLKAGDTVGNCQRQVSSFWLNWSLKLQGNNERKKHLLHRIVCSKYGLNWSLKLQGNNERKKHLLHRIVCFQMPQKGFMPEAFLRFKLLG